MFFDGGGGRQESDTWTNPLKVGGEKTNQKVEGEIDKRKGEKGHYLTDDT